MRSALEIVRGNRPFWQLSYQLRMQPEVLAGFGGETRMWSESIRSRLEDLLRSAGAAGAPGAAVDEC